MVVKKEQTMHMFDTCFWICIDYPQVYVQLPMYLWTKSSYDYSELVNLSSQVMPMFYL